MPPLTVQEATLAFGLLFACYTDIRWWKIPNVLTGLLIVAGFVLNVALGDWQLATFGFLLAFAIHFPLWVMGVQKGGDAKLMMGLGALVGASEMVETTFWKFLLMLPIGLTILAASGNLGRFVEAAKHTWRKAQGQPTGKPPELTYMPFGPIIAVAWVSAWVTDWLDLI